LRRREPAQFPGRGNSLDKRYIQLKLDEVDIGFAGRRSEKDVVHEAISNLTAGNELKVRVDGSGRIKLQNSQGITVGRTAKNFKPPAGLACRSAQVAAVLKRTRDQSGPEFQDALKCDSWEVVIPLLVFGD